MEKGSTHSLDEEFRQILVMIKPLINKIDNVSNLEQYSIWLERLNHATQEEKLERNKYLLELANQIYDGVLKAPFIYGPPSGRLPCIEDFQNSENYESEEEPNSSDWSAASSTLDGGAHVRFKGHHPPKKKKTTRLSRRYGVAMLPSETTSWCDLSEGSDYSYGDTDEDEIAKMKLTKELPVPECLIESEKRPSAKSDRSIRTQFTMTQFEEQRGSTHEEIEALRMRMKDLAEVKTALRDTHCLTENRKIFIEDLQARLADAQKQNTELRLKLGTHENLLKELEETKSKEMEELKRTFTGLRQQEIKVIKQQHAKEKQRMEELHQRKIEEHQTKIEQLQGEFDKMKNSDESKAVQLQQKDELIQRLRSDLGEGKNRYYDKTDDQEVAKLKKSISKLQKLLCHNEKEYSKKIEKLTLDLELKEAASQAQLRTQRVDLMINSTNAKQEELKNVLDQLEEKYKVIIRSIQAQALETKKKDDKRIQDLEWILAKNKIVY